MSLNNFTPELWSNQILIALRKSLVYGALFNSDYEGLIQQLGDTVRISSVSDINIQNYVKDTAISSPQVLSSAQTTLTISQARYFNFAVDSVDKAQNNVSVMQEATSRAAYQLAENMDEYYASLYTDALVGIGTSGVPIVPVAPTQANVGLGTTVYDLLVQMNQILTQNLVPKQGRWMVVPPWITTQLTQDIRFSSFNTAEARQTITTGQLDASRGMAADAYLGKIAGCDLYESNNAPHIGGTVGIAGSQDVVLAAHSMAFTKAEGLSEVIAYQHPNYFNDALKSIALFGARCSRPNSAVVAYLQHP